MIEQEQSPFPNQLNPTRSDSWAIVYGAPNYALCHPTHGKRGNGVGRKVLFDEYAAKLINPENPTFLNEIRTMAQDRAAWKCMEVNCWHLWDPP